jgi:hypothetical protein
LLWISACVATATQAADKLTASANATNYFTITGMHCDGCANGLTGRIEGNEGRDPAPKSPSPTNWPWSPLIPTKSTR